MNPYNACTSCGCYVKSNDPTCPFCGAPQKPRGELPGARTARMTRAHWLAFGSTLVLAGCSGDASDSPRSSMDGSMSMKTSTDATAATEASNTSTEAPNNGTIAVVDEASSPEAEAGCWPSARDGGLLCDPFFGYDAATFCDRATEWCFTNHGFGPTQCVSFGSTCAPYALVDACDSVFNWNAAACDAGDHRCACLSVNCSSGTCQEDDAGGITISCGSCYGAPPARLERLAA